jgi:hypothetical protein
MTPRASSERVASSSEPTSLAVERMAAAVSLKRWVASSSACCISRIIVACVWRRASAALLALVAGDAGELAELRLHLLGGALRAVSSRLVV